VKPPTGLPDLRDPLQLVAFGFGAGRAPWAPGTAGTLVGVAFYLALSGLALPVYLAVVAALFVVGVPVCTHTSLKLGVHDHPGIVWDEVVGYLVTMIAAPRGWAWVLAGFVLFRIFDIVKPWPIDVLDRRVSGGFGIMLDDVLAGAYALACMQILAHVLARP
jgi:phosphatidylglycerophosphatase A